MIEWIKSLFTGTADEELGALLDNRPEEEKAKDYKFEEAVSSAAAVNWVEKKELRNFGVQNQRSSSSCVAQSARREMRVLYKVNHNLDLDFSATDIYSRRRNKPDPGMYADDAYKIAGLGVTLNAVLPSDEKSEYQMTNPEIKPYMRDIADVFKVPNYLQLPTGDIETAASTIQKTGKAVRVNYYFTRDEWAKEVPTVIVPGLDPLGSKTLRHAVVAVDFTIYKGKKCLVIEDSAHFGGINRRYITEDFHKKRNTYSGYMIRFSFDPPEVSKPSFTGSTTSLQDCLKFEGVFPSNIESTGVFGPITVRAVKDFQSKYGLEPVGTVGPLTTKKLNELYP